MSDCTRGGEFFKKKFFFFTDLSLVRRRREVLPHPGTPVRRPSPSMPVHKVVKKINLKTRLARAHTRLPAGRVSARFFPPLRTTSIRPGPDDYRSPGYLEDGLIVRERASERRRTRARAIRDHDDSQAAPLFRARKRRYAAR